MACHPVKHSVVTDNKEAADECSCFYKLLSLSSEDETYFAAERNTLIESKLTSAFSCIWTLSCMWTLKNSVFFIFYDDDDLLILSCHQGGNTLISNLLEVYNLSQITKMINDCLCSTMFFVMWGCRMYCVRSKKASRQCF